MLYNTHEGIHYIFDRYAFLNKAMEDGHHAERISPESGHDDIETVIRKARAMFHEDRQARTGESMQREAGSRMQRVLECAEILLNPDLKPAYDEKLAAFKRDRPKFVSESGAALIDPMAEVFDIDLLLRDEAPDTSGVMDYATKLLQHNEVNFQKTKTLYEAFPDNDDIRSLYRAALMQKLAYLSIQEDMAWIQVGYINRKGKTRGHVMYADEYGEKVEDALAFSQQKDIPAALGQRLDVARIGLSKMPLLLKFNGSADASLSKPVQDALSDPAEAERVAAHLKDVANRNFDARANRAREVARQKQEVIEELVQLTPLMPLNERDPNNPLYDLYIIDPTGDGVAQLHFTFNVSNKSLPPPEVFNPPLAVAELKKQTFANNAYMIERTPGIDDLMVEVTACAGRLVDQYAPQPSTATPPTSSPS